MKKKKKEQRAMLDSLDAHLLASLVAVLHVYLA